MTKDINLKFRITATVITIISIIIAYVILNLQESNFSEQSTDDAYVQTHMTVIVPQVSGIITNINVADHQQVKVGDTLMIIDDRELKIAVNTAKAVVDNLKGKLKQQQSIIAQAQTAVTSSFSNLKLAELNRNRYSNLAQDGSGTVQGKQEAQTQWETKQASYDQAKAGLEVAKVQIEILEAELEKAKASLEDAELKLSYTQIKAPISGVIDQRHGRVGGYARVGEPLLTIVPLDDLYVEANFRETQLVCMNIGQLVDISVDALPNVILKGHIDTFAPASGVSYSLIPPHNATGNFTKITQRLPIRIKFENEQNNINKLKVGMSVKTTIKTDKCK